MKPETPERPENPAPQTPDKADLNAQLKAISNFLKRSSEARRAVPSARELSRLADKLDKASESKAARYCAIEKGLRELADKAREEAKLLPDRTIKDHHDWATEVFINIWLDAGQEQPTKYESSKAAIALEKVFEDAGIGLGPSAIVGLLARALRKPRVPRGVAFTLDSIVCAYAKATGLDGNAVHAMLCGIYELPGRPGSIYEQPGRLTKEAMEAMDPVAAAVRDFVIGRRTWTETGAELLALLNDRKPPEGWPKPLKSVIEQLRKSLESLNSDVG